jgi:hypothetical protein
MIGLDGARVLLLDDEPEESLPVIQAFSKAGIPLLYYDGQVQGFPTPTGKPRGIRLAILDMDLGEGSTDKDKASALVQKLSLILRVDNGPYGILIWTKHPELRQLVTDYIFAHTDLPNPVFIANLTKTECKSGSTFSLQKLSNRLKETLSTSAPMNCLQAWEGSCHSAATTVTNTLSELTNIQAANLSDWISAWRLELQRLLRAIGVAWAEKSLTEENCLPSVFFSMNPLQSDRMDLLVGKVAGSVSGHSAAIYGAGGAADARRRAKINSMLHLASHELNSVAPGNVYRFSQESRAWMPTLLSLLEGCVKGDAAARKTNLETLLKAARRVAVEISPVCDYAQNKVRQSRLIAGFVVPIAESTVVNPSGAFLRVMGPFHLESRQLRIPDGIYMIYLNSRYPVSAKPSVLRRLPAFARLRPQLLADVQVWSSYQATRQGVMMLE